MEFEDVKEQMDEEARRVAVAFEVAEWKFYEYGPMSGYSGKNATGIHIDWGFSPDTGGLDRIFVGGIPGGTHIRIIQGEWKVLLRSYLREIMMHGLYRLGFEDEAVFEQLGGLSNHQRMELRLSTPRELWPNKWLDEEGEQL